MAATPRGERGAATVEVMLLVPALLIVVACLVAGARVWFARAAVADAAQAGARAATIERTTGAADHRARGVIADSLATAGVRCGSARVSLDLRGFAAAPGTPASVRADVSCQVALSDLSGLALPGSVQARATGVSAIDTYRSRR